MGLNVHIPRPPSLNHNHSNNGRGGRHKAGRYDDWIKRAGWALNPQTAGWVMLTEPVKIAIQVNKDKADIDNLLKPAFDLLQKHRVFENDSQVTELHVWHDEQCGDLMFIHVEAA